MTDDQRLFVADHIGYSGRAVPEFHRSSLFTRISILIHVTSHLARKSNLRVGECQTDRKRRRRVDPTVRATPSTLRFIADDVASVYPTAGPIPMNTGCLIVIPARLASTRLPEKLLRKVGGKSVLQHTFESARGSKVAEGIVVAVDDQQIANEVDSFGGRWIMTSPTCASGTDRIAEVSATMPEVEVFVNVQGDEPEIDPRVIDLVASTLINDRAADMSTAAAPIRDRRVLEDPSVVKIVMALDRSTNEAGQGRALYFSRAAVPHTREGIDESILAAEPPIHWHHIGLYAYRREFLRWFATQPPSLLEQAERLEQLRAIEAGKKIVVARVESATPGIDTQADLDAFIARQQA